MAFIILIADFDTLNRIWETVTCKRRLSLERTNAERSHISRPAQRAAE
jgi:hypothetical protein